MAVLLKLILLSMGCAAAEPVLSCLRNKCNPLVKVCEAVRSCGDVLRCTDACNDNTTCVDNCFTKGIAAKAPIGTVPLISLDMCGGFNQCFNYASRTVTAVAIGDDGCAAITETSGSLEYHCDQAKDGEAVMCITTRSLLDYGGNRCCKGKWQFSAQQAVEKHGFNAHDADAWNKKCDGTKCCKGLDGEACYQKQLADLGKIPPCSSEVVV